jgi:DNA-binding PadR family transcriptional regulator
VRDEQRKFLKYNHPVANLLVFDNLVRMTRAIRRLDTDGHSISDEVLAVAQTGLEPAHGYALMKDIEQLSDGRAELTKGTLYCALHRLLEEGCIERFEQADTSREKQSYCLAGAGRKQLQLELDRMKQLTTIAAVRLRTREV